MKAKMTFILETKINIPQLPEQTTFRVRLHRKLDEGLRKKVTIVSAPAGFGKARFYANGLRKEN